MKPSEKVTLPRAEGEGIDPAVGAVALPLSHDVAVRLAKLLEIKEILDARKQLYEEYDRLIIELVGLGFVSAQGLKGELIQIKDCFKGGNTAWTSAAVKRFDLEVVTKELQEKRARRAAKGGSDE